MSRQLLDIHNTESGIAQAWLMGTMGNKPAQRRSVKKDLLSYSIPEVCHKVTEIATSSMSLRVTSNLLYGLSLIYKQQVTYMATDLSCVYDRMASQWLSRIESDQTVESRAFRKRSHMSLLVDDPRFDIQEDFAPTLTNGDELPDMNALLIRDLDLHINGLSGQSLNPDVVEAEERDRSFNDYINRTNNTTRVSLDDDYAVDFEFGPDGEIVGDHILSGQDLLAHLNTEEDFTTLGATTEDLTKGDSSGDNDRHFLMTENAASVQVAPATTSKRRRLRLCFDDSTTISGRQSETVPISSPQNQLLIGDVFAEIFSKQHRYLNQQYHAIFGSNVGSLVFSRPLSRPQSIQSYLSGEVNEIELGRDRASRRSSTDFIPDLELERRVTLDERFQEDFMFDMDPVIPELYIDEDEWSSETAHVDAMNRLREFKVFLTERARDIESNSEGATKCTLESLIPSKAIPGEATVTRKLAANSFALLLELTNDGSIEIEEEEQEGPSASDQIYIKIA